MTLFVPLSTVPAGTWTTLATAPLLLYTPVVATSVAYQKLVDPPAAWVLGPPLDVARIVARPRDLISNISGGGGQIWGVTGAPTLPEAIDDEPFHDSDASYIAAEPLAFLFSTVRMRFAPLRVRPNDVYVLSVIARVNAGATNPVSLAVNLFDGASATALPGWSFIVDWNAPESPPFGEYFETKLALTSAQAEAIASFSDVQIEIEANQFADVNTFFVTQVTLEAPAQPQGAWVKNVEVGQ